MESNIVQNIAALKHLPSSWSIKAFEDIVKDVSAGNKKTLKSDFLDKGEFLIVDQGQSLIAGYTNNKELLVKAKPPYVVFGDHTRAFKYVDVPFAMGADGTKVLKPKIESTLIEKYLFYFFLSLEIPNTGYNRHFKYLKELKIPLPPLAEQQKIAAILDAADNLRQKDQQLVERYTALSQSLFLEMFGDPVTNPMGWDSKSLQSITSKIGSGSTPRGGKEAYFDEGISLIRSLNIHDNNFLMKNLAFIDDKQADELANVIVEESDVLLNITGASVCRCAIVPTEILPARVNQHVSILRCDTNQANPYYLLHLIISAQFKQKLLNLAGANGATREALTKSQLSELSILTPPIALQNQFAERIQLIEGQKQQAQRSLAKSEALFNSLLQRAFTGELTAKMAA